MKMLLKIRYCKCCIITVKNVDYHCIIHSNSKSEASNLLKNLKNSKNILLKNIFLFSIYKMVDTMEIYKSLNINIGTE